MCTSMYTCARPHAWTCIYPPTHTHTHLLPKHTWGNNYTMSRRFWKNWMSHVLATSSWWHGSSSMWHLSVVTHISGNGSWRSRGVTWCFSSLQHGEALLRETIARQGLHSQTQVTSSAARRECHREMQSLTWVLRSGDSSENRAWTFWHAEMADSFKGMSNSQSPRMILRGWGKAH